MPITRETFAAAVAIAAVGCGIAIGASNLGQDAVFSEARAYERFMGRWSRNLAPLFVRFGAVRDGDTLLDVGSGTGALAAALAAAAPSGRVVGIDPAASYVVLAQASQEGTRVRFQVGDAPDRAFVLRARAWAVRGVVR